MATAVRPGRDAVRASYSRDGDTRTATPSVGLSPYKLRCSICPTVRLWRPCRCRRDARISRCQPFHTSWNGSLLCNSNALSFNQMAEGTLRYTTRPARALVLILPTFGRTRGNCVAHYLIQMSCARRLAALDDIHGRVTGHSRARATGTCRTGARLDRSTSSMCHSVDSHSLQLCDGEHHAFAALTNLKRRNA